MTARQGVTAAGLASGVVLAGLLATPLPVGLVYLGVGLLYTLGNGWRNRSLLRRAVQDVSERAEAAGADHPAYRPGIGREYAALLLFAVVLFYVLCWPAMIAWDLYDWWMDRDEDEDEA